MPSGVVHRLVRQVRRGLGLLVWAMLVGILVQRAIFQYSFVGTAVTNNLLRNGFVVSAVTDIKTELCNGYPESIKVDKLFRFI